jgi:purine-binding chemotaxis protein CheW
MSDSRQYCTFRLGDLHFGVPVLRVQEVLRYQEMTHVPLAPAMVRGLINLRGQIVTAIDLRSRLAMPALDADRLPMNVVVRSEEGAVSLLVDAIGDVVEVEDSAFEPPPQNLAGVTREVTSGVYKLEHQLLLILDLDRTLQTHGIGRANDKEKSTHALV